jgi:hypothetical protein
MGLLIHAFVFRCIVPVVEIIFYFVFYFSWYISIHVFDIKGAKLYIFVYFCIFEIVNQVTRIFDIVFGSCNILLSSVVMYSLSLYLGLSFQFTIRRMGLCCLRSFMVPYKRGVLWFMLIYFHLLFLFTVFLLLLMLFIMFFVAYS